MKIEFSWKVSSPERSSQALVGKVVGRFSGLRLWPGPVYRNEWETLILEVPGLSDPYVYAILGAGSDGRLHESDYCAVVAQIQEALKKQGVEELEVRVDGFYLRQYAAQQEDLARRRKKSMEDAIAMLRKTRRFFGKQVFEDIRRKLEETVADPVR